MIKRSPIAVIGAGSWGTALAIALARNDQDVHLWGPETEFMKQMVSTHRNDACLPDITFPDTLTPYVDYEQAIEGITDFLLVVPSHAFHDALTDLNPYLQKNSRIAWATKGLDPKTEQLLSVVATEVIGEDYPLAILSGPSFAKEVARNIPTAVTLAATSNEFANDLIERFNSKTFNVHLSDDLIGMQLCGAVKNVLAIAAGVSDGLQFGVNTRSAIIALGLTELSRLGMKMGAKQETFLSLAGAGDVVLTCTDKQSRNYRFGLALGQGCSSEEAKKTIGQVVEGFQNSKQVYRLAKRYDIEMPIISHVYSLLYEEASPQNVIVDMLHTK